MGFVLEQAYWVYVRNSYLERKVWFGLVWFGLEKLGLGSLGLEVLELWRGGYVKF